MTSWAHTSYLVRYLKQFEYIKQRKIHNGKVHRHKKSLFIPIELHSVTISEVINHNQYKQSHQKKKKKAKEKERMKKGKKKKRKEQKKEAKKKEGTRKERAEEGGKEEGERKGRGGKEEKRKRDGRSLGGKKRKREKERWRKRGKEGKGEERREREREKEIGENGAKGALPSPDAFPSAKLGNNMTPIKGRLGKTQLPQAEARQN